MNIVIIGATGTIGSAVTTAFKEQHQVIEVSHSSGTLRIDISDPDSIKQTMQDIHQVHGDIDALICATGKATFKDYLDLNSKDWQLGLSNKLMGQINLVSIAQQYLSQGASITLTAGILCEQHIATGVSASTINAAVNSFVGAVAPLLPNNIRINSVSPTVLTESMHIYKDYFPGFIPVSAQTVAQAYIRSVLGIDSGKIYTVI